ncbi:MAG: pantoate--beta-alanine ligase [Puniceicoccaceae bacterium]|nr:MAG: pantoate--beta-alanine ligase [Puniceicoccaceae bacterium]
MQVIESVYEMQSLAINLRAKDRLIGLVPTMGCLHAGHLSLIEAARKVTDTVVVSIFVNPIQFGPNEDFDAYPRQRARDLELCEEAGVDIVFAPEPEALYPRGFSTYVVEELVSRPLCGISRPNHFRGVLTVVAKLFNIIHPDTAVFGQKDAQQAAVIKKMVNDLHFCIDILVEPTAREPDGLAMSSRNRYLSPTQREDARALYLALQAAKALVDAGVRNVDRVVAEATHTLSSHRRVRVIYVSVVDRCTMESAREIIPGKCLLAVAAWVDEVRLIDNLLL